MSMRDTLSRSLIALGIVKAADFATPFFGPGEPSGVDIDAATRDDAPAREFDYPDGWNVLTGPPMRTRVTSVTGTSFAALRNVAQSVWQIRLVIEHCKDEIEAVPWRIALFREEGESESDYLARSAASRAKIERLTARFERPDGFRSWSIWIRTLVEELLVLDAPAVYRWDDDLIILDGSTIKPLLDEAGRVPSPPLPAFEQYVHGEKYGQWTREELFYVPRNRQIHKVFGFSPVEQTIALSTMAANRAASQILRNSDGNLPPALIEAPEGWSAKQLRDFQSFFDAAMSSPERRTRITFIPSGAKPSYPGQEFLLKDEFDEWIARACAYAFGVSPNIFIRQQNRASAEQYEAESSQRGAGARKRWIKELIDKILTDWYDAPECEFVWDDEEPLSERDRAEVDEIDLRSGARTVNEVREDRGLPPLDEGEGDGRKPAESPRSDEIDDDDGEDVDDGEGATEKAIRRRFAAKAATPRVGFVVSSVKPEIYEVEVERLTVALGDFFRAESTRIGAALAATTAKAADPIRAFDVGIEFAWNDLTPPLAGELQPVYLSGYAAGLADIGAAISSLVEPSKLATAWADAHAAKLVVAIEEATRTWVRGLVRIALTEGWSPMKLASEIAQHWAFSYDRARVIARTELAFAQSNGTLKAWEESGLVEKKRWVLGPDAHRKPDECDLNAGAVVKVDAAFPSGHVSPPAHPNCRCVVTAVIQPPKGV